MTTPNRLFTVPKSDKEQSQRAAAFFEAITDEKQGANIGYLAERWKDEAGYEDIQDYKDALQKVANEFGVIIGDMIMRPFGCYFETDGRTYKLTCTLKGDRGTSEYRRVK